MNNIKTFNEFSRAYVWEPMRVPSEDRYMPNKQNEELYKKAVKEEIEEVLKSVYKLSDNDIKKFQDTIWNKHFDDWKDILVDSMVNWDTPSQCAQKIVNKTKTHFNLT